MTANKKQKKRVRAYARETGMGYQAALQLLHPPHQPCPAPAPLQSMQGFADLSDRYEPPPTLKLRQGVNLGQLVPEQWNTEPAHPVQVEIVHARRR